MIQTDKDKIEQEIKNWQEVDLFFKEKDFYKCNQCGDYHLKDGYENKNNPLCIGCEASSLHISIT